MCRELCLLLEPVETREQLLNIQPRLKEKFNALVTLMRAASDGEGSPLEEGNIQAERLQEMLLRVYQEIEGGRAVIEKAQQEALVRLDAHERTRLKRLSQHHLL